MNTPRGIFQSGRETPRDPKWFMRTVWPSPSTFVSPRQTARVPSVVMIELSPRPVTKKLFRPPTTNIAATAMSSASANPSPRP